MYLAELAYQASPTRKTLKRWDNVITASADYMASYAWKNASSGYFDLGPPYVSPLIFLIKLRRLGTVGVS